MPEAMGCCVCAPCVCVPASPPWGTTRVAEETVPDLEAYKERLELEIRQLERKIQGLRDEARSST